jgi:hypothetical protein
MKTTLILMLGCLLMLASCSSQPLVTESDTGRSHPASHLDGLRGMSGGRDAEQMHFADAIIAKAGKREVDSSGTIYPGTVKVIRWQHKGVAKYTARRLATWPDGFQCWQGPQAPSGFYSANLTTTYLP